MNSGLYWFNKEILDQQSAGISPFLKLTSLTSAIKEASSPSNLFLANQFKAENHFEQVTSVEDLLKLSSANGCGA